MAKFMLDEPLGEMKELSGQTLTNGSSQRAHEKRDL